MEKNTNHLKCFPEYLLCSGLAFYCSIIIILLGYSVFLLYFSKLKTIIFAIGIIIVIEEAGWIAEYLLVVSFEGFGLFGELGEAFFEEILRFLLRVRLLHEEFCFGFCCFFN